MATGMRCANYGEGPTRISDGGSLDDYPTTNELTQQPAIPHAASGSASAQADNLRPYRPNKKEIRMKIIASVALLCAFALTALAQCNPIFPASKSWGSVSSVLHHNSNSYAGSYPNLAIGSQVDIYGSFPGIINQSITSNDPLTYTAQGIRIYVDSDCYPAPLNYLSGTQIQIQLPPTLPAGSHTLYLYKNSYGGYVYHVTRQMDRWVPAVGFNPPSGYFSDNTAVGLFFSRPIGSSTFTLRGTFQQGIPVKQSVPQGEEIAIQFLITGAYMGGSSPTLTATLGGLNSGLVSCADGTGFYFRGQQFYTILVPQSIANSGGLYWLTFTANGAAIPLQALLNF